MQHRQAVAHGFNWRLALCQFARHQMGNSFGIGFRPEIVAFRLKHGAKLGEILDDAVMNDRETLGNVRMRIAFYRLTVRGPTGMPDTDDAGKWLSGQTLFQIDQLAFRAAAIELTVLQCGDTGRS